MFYLCLSVSSLFVCLPVREVTKKVMNDYSGLFGVEGRGPNNNRLDFGGDLQQDLASGF